MRECVRVKPTLRCHVDQLIQPGPDSRLHAGWQIFQGSVQSLQTLATSWRKQAESNNVNTQSDNNIVINTVIDIEKILPLFEIYEQHFPQHYVSNSKNLTIYRSKFDVFGTEFSYFCSLSPFYLFVWLFVFAVWC